jgi:hypothetical protein
MNYEQSNVGSGMVPCREGCRCNECEIERLSAENRALRSAFASLRDRLTEVSLQAEDAVIAINMDSASTEQTSKSRQKRLNVQQGKPVMGDSAEVEQRDKLIKLLLKECEEMDFDYSNACMNWSMLEHSQIECALCQLRTSAAEFRRRERVLRPFPRTQPVEDSDYELPDFPDYPEG